MVGQQDRIHIAASGDLRAAAVAANRLTAVAEASVRDGAIDLIVDDGKSVLPVLLESVQRAGVEVTSVEVVEPDLEAVFLHLTGKALRD